MYHLDLFSGIGGFAYAAKTVWGKQYQNVGFCDNDWFCQQVLKKNFPGCTVYEDIRALTNTNNVRCQEPGLLQQRGSRNWRDGKVIDLITGGFPCQPFSHAGRRKGTSDDRYLWPEMFRVISEFKPAWVIAENVSGLVSWSEGMVLEQVCSDLESEGYEVQPFIIPACAVNAPHRRDRIWIVANRSSERRQQESGSTFSYESQDEGRRTQDYYKSSGSNKGTPANSRPQRRPEGFGGFLRSAFKKPIGKDNKYFDWSCDWREVALATCYDGMDDGLSERVVRFPDGTETSYAKWRKEALKAYGNAIVPQVAMQVMEAIRTIESNI